MPRALRALMSHVIHVLFALLLCVLSVSRESCPTCSRASRALFPTCSRAQRASFPTCSRTLRASYPTYLLALSASFPERSRFLRASCLRALVPHVTSAQCVLVAPVSRVSQVLCPMCFHALWVLFPYLPLMPCTLNILCANFTFYALEFPCLKVLLFHSFPACDFLGWIYWSWNNLNWRSALINSMICMICLNSLKPNMRTYT